MSPSAASAWISFQNSRRALGSTPAVGSSSRSSCGLGRVQAPSASRCFQPPESSPASCSLAARESDPLDHRARRRGRLRQPVKARDEFQVLAHREVLVEAEALGHVADMALDLVGLGADVVAETGALALVGREQPAQHADGGGLAGTVGTEESVDLAALDLHREVAHDLAAAEGFGQAMDVDGDLGRRRGCAGHCSGPRETLTGWPTRRCSGRSGRASIRNTSFERSSML